MMKRTKSVVSLLSFTMSLVLVLACSTAFAAKDVEIDGLLIDKTFTAVGHNFFEIFSLRWEAPSNNNNFNIVVNEDKSPTSRGTTVSVEVNSNLVYQSFVGPNYDDCLAPAQEATEKTAIFISSLRGKYNKDTQEDEGEE